MRKILLVLLLGIVIFAWLNRFTLERAIVEKSVNHFSGPLFEKSVTVGSAHISRDLHFHMKDFRATLQTANGPVPFHIESVHSETPVTDALREKGVWFTFHNLRFSGQGGKISGRVLYAPKKEWFITGVSVIQNLGLEELSWLNPENLKSARGPLNGNLNFQMNKSGAQFFHFNVRVKEPGGRLPSQLFSALMPYIPAAAAPHQRALSQLAEEKETVAFKAASLQTELMDPQKMKVILQILIPEYNLNLNLNLEVRIDQKHAFNQLIQVMGLIKIS